MGGKAGGLALKEQYGHAHFVEIGKKGGRPRAKTLETVRMTRGGNGHLRPEITRSNNLRFLLAELKKGAE